jgi:hypothetical protein
MAVPVISISSDGQPLDPAVEVLSLEVTSRIGSMFHVFLSIIHVKSSKFFQGYTRRKSSHTISFN